MQFSFHHHKRIARRAAAVILLSTALVCSAGVLTPAARVQAATSAELKKKRNQTQSQLNSARNKASSLKNEQDSVSEELAQKTKEIAENMTAISMMQDQISDLEDQIKVKQQEYEAARADEQQQYESMKKRIQFMYEKGNTSYVQLLLQASSLGDALNKAEYVERLYDYDRKMLKKYEQTVQQVADAKKALEDEKSELETTQAELKENETELESQQSELQSKYDNYDELIAEAQSEAALLKQQVQQENAQISTASSSRKAAGRGGGSSQGTAGGGRGSRRSVLFLRGEQCLCRLLGCCRHRDIDERRTGGCRNPDGNRLIRGLLFRQLLRILTDVHEELCLGGFCERSQRGFLRGTVCGESVCLRRNEPDERSGLLGLYPERL